MKYFLPSEAIASLPAVADYDISVTLLLDIAFQSFIKLFSPNKILFLE
jgi:hypothetical protein